MMGLQDFLETVKKIKSCINDRMNVAEYIIYDVQCQDDSVQDDYRAGTGYIPGINQDFWQ